MKWEIIYRTSDGDNDTFSFDTYARAEAWLADELDELLPPESVTITDRNVCYEYGGEWVAYKRKYTPRRKVRGYTLEFECEHLDWEAVRKADKIGGFIEFCGIADSGKEFVSWHGLKWRQVPRAQKFVRNTWGIETEPLGEYYDGCICKCVKA